MNLCYICINSGSKRRSQPLKTSTYHDIPDPKVSISDGHEIVTKYQVLNFGDEYPNGSGETRNAVNQQENLKFRETR